MDFRLAHSAAKRVAAEESNHEDAEVGFSTQIAQRLISEGAQAADVVGRLRDFFKYLCAQKPLRCRRAHLMRSSGCQSAQVEIDNRSRIERQRLA
jgi:hypothetical protein